MSQSMLAIKTKLGSSSNSLRDYSAARGLSAPDSMLEFDAWLGGGGGGLTCECVTIYNEGGTTGRYSYFRCGDGAEVTRNITTSGGPQVVCIQGGTSINVISGTLTDSYCGTSCNSNTDCTAC